jgi:HEPN domain-containing protein
MNRWKDWYDQGKRDYTRAILDIQYGYYEWACFTLQQSSEKVIKALGLARGVTLWGHSLTEMLKLLNGFASGKPADYFTETQAQEGLHAADRIIRFCEGYLPGSG